MPLIDQLKHRLRFRTQLTEMGPKDSRRYPTATLRQVEAAERQLGFRLPELLRDIYTQVANGGFGPAYGLIGVAGGAPLYAGEGEYSIVDLYSDFRRRNPGEAWREKFLPICDWGCDIAGYLDCALPEAPVMVVDPNLHGHGPWGRDFCLHARSFEQWMQRWLSGERLAESIALYGDPVLGFEERAKREAASKSSAEC